MNLLFGLLAMALFTLFIHVATGIVRTEQSAAGSRRFALPFGRSEKVYPMRRSPYRATSIASGGNTCSAVKSQLHDKFLDLDDRIPALPVAGCKMGHCNCMYVHHAVRVSRQRRNGNNQCSKQQCPRDDKAEHQ